MKKGKWLVWAGITVGVFFIARILFEQLGVFSSGGRAIAMQGMMQQGGHGMHAMRGQGHVVGFGISSLLIHVAIFVGGWFTWKLAGKSCVRKWIGLALMAWGAMVLLPNILVIPAIMIVAYFAYKISRNEKSASAPAAAASFSSVASQQADYLDQWEATVQKEQ